VQIEIFGKQGCHLCDDAKRIIGEKMNLEYKYMDMETQDALALYCFRGYDVAYNMKYPVITVDAEHFNIIGKAVKHIKERAAL
jgi:glutaredoxin